MSDILVTKEIMKLFKNTVRVIDKKHLAGIYPIDIHHLQRLQKVLPEMFSDAILKKYEITIGYQGKAIKSDFSKMGFEYHEERIVNNILIQGIPVPWQMLRKAGIDHQKFNVVLTPKQLR